MQESSLLSIIKKLRQPIIAILVVVALFLTADLTRYERLDNKPCPFDSFCYAVFDRWKQRVCYATQNGIACSKQELVRLESGLLTDEEVGFSSNSSSGDVWAYAIIGSVFAVALIWMFKKSKRKSLTNTQNPTHLNIGVSPMTFYLSIKSLWTDEITNVDQAQKIIKWASRYAFWYWLLSGSMFITQANKVRPHLRSVDPSGLNPLEALILSPVFIFVAPVVILTALMCSYTMPEKGSRVAAWLLLVLWSFQAWLRTVYLQPDLIGTPLFIIIVWTTVRGLLAANKIAFFKKESRHV